MAEQITITIDGKECTCEKGEYIYDVAKRNGISIPGYCRSDAYPEHRASCRMCIVEVEEHGRSKIVASCVYPVAGECTVQTKSPRVEEDRLVLRALLKESMSDAEAEGFERLLELDNDKCILCGLCVQACESLGTGAISLINRGVEKDIDTPYRKASSTCVGCLSCANICPVNAITYTQTETTRTIWHREFELVYCENCGALMGTRESVAWAAKGVGEEAPTVCDECRKRALANDMMRTYRYV